jgi:hypothetical protein
VRSVCIRILLASAVALAVCGCASERAFYAAAPPPPPPVYGAYQEAPPLVQYAERQGFRAGLDDGSRDSYNRWGYHPQHDRKFHETPGYDPRLGPYGAYRDYFRGAYLRGYARAFGRS